MAKKHLGVADIEAQTALELPDRQTMCGLYLVRFFDQETFVEQEADTEQEARNICEQRQILNGNQFYIASNNNTTYQQYHQEQNCIIYQKSQTYQNQLLSWPW